MNSLKLICEIKEIKPETGTEEREGRVNKYKVKVKITNTFHPSLPLPKGIRRRGFMIKRNWIYPFIPKVGSRIGVDGKEIGINILKIQLSNKLLSLTLLPELGGRMTSLQYRNNDPIQSPLLYGREACLACAGITEDIAEKPKVGLWKFEIKKQLTNSVTLECKKKGWAIKKTVSLDNNIIHQEFEITRQGVKKKLDLNFNETLSLIPHLHNLNIHIPTIEKVFQVTPQPIVSPWYLPKHYYGLRNGLILKNGDTVIVWSAKSKQIEEIIIRENEWLLNVRAYWNKLKMKKGETSLFKSVIILGEDFRIDDRGIGIRSKGEWLWVGNGELMS